MTLSGFLSQNDNSEGWSKLADIVEPQGITCFDMKWESIQYSNIAKKVGVGLLKLGISESFELLLTGGKISNLIKITTGAGKIKTFYTTLY